MSVVWHRGVPWLAEALTSAVADGVADAVTEVAREFILTIEHDPGRVPPRSISNVARGRYAAVISPDLVVVGHGRPEKADPAASERQPGPEGVPADAGRPKGRGPKSYDELSDWLSDEGYQVIKTKGRNSGHLAVVNSRGARLVTLSSTPSDRARSLDNDVATCRKVLGIPLRRTK